MFEIVLFVALRLLLLLLVVLLGIKVYRKLSGWSDFNKPVTRRYGSGRKIAMAGQKGFIGTRLQGGKQKSSVKKVPDAKIRSPWGW